MSEASGMRIKKKRTDLGLTQAELAALVDLKVQNISYFEQGREPSYTVLPKIAKALHTSCEYIILGVEANQLDIASVTGLSGEEIDRITLKQSAPQKGKLIRDLLDWHDYDNLEDVYCTTIAHATDHHCALKEISDFLWLAGSDISALLDENTGATSQLSSHDKAKLQTFFNMAKSFVRRVEDEEVVDKEGKLFIVLCRSFLDEMIRGCLPSSYTQVSIEEFYNMLGESSGGEPNGAPQEEE